MIPNPADIAASETSLATQWAEILDDFERLVWPPFESRGYARAEALQAHLTNMVLGQLVWQNAQLRASQEEALAELEEEQGEWDDEDDAQPA